MTSPQADPRPHTTALVTFNSGPRPGRRARRQRKLDFAALGPRLVPPTKDRTRQLDQASQTPALGFFAFGITIAVLFLRPAELIPALNGLPIYYATILAAIALAGPRLRHHFRWHSLRARPIVLCVCGVFLFAVLSQLAHFYVGGVLSAVIELGKALVFFGLTITYIDTPRRLNRTLATTAVVATIMIGLCTVDYLELLDVPTIDQFRQNERDEFGRIEYTVMRLRGTGIFNDPNDLAMLVVFVATVSYGFLTQRPLGLARFLWLMPLILMAIALLCTHSRGGLLAAGAAALTLALFRYGKRAMFVAGLAVLAVLPAIAGRQADIDLEDGTANERLLLWREGFEALKSSDAIFGTGFQSYDEFAGLVAHNSFVHAYVELGLMGGTLFFGCFFFAALALFRSFRREPERHAPLLRHWRPYLVAALAGWCASMFSLSRCYVEPTYLLLGTLAAAVHLYEHAEPRRRQLVFCDKKDLQLLASCSAGLFVSLWLFVRVVTA